MPSRSPSPPPPPFRGGRGVYLDEPMAVLSLRPLRLRTNSPGQTDAAMPTPSPPSLAFPCPTSQQTSYASVVRRGLPSVSQTQQHEQSCSESEVELESPPCITIIKMPGDQEPRPPTSPPAGPPRSIDVETTAAFQFPTPGQISYASVVGHGLPSVSQTKQQEESFSGLEFGLDSTRLTIIKIPDDQEPSSPSGGPPPSFGLELAVWPTLGSDPEEWHSSDDDVYFKSLVDNFITAAEDMRKSSEENIHKEEPSLQEISNRYAESALKSYNNDKNNKVKYNLIRAITSCGMVDVERCYGHVNFIAKENQQNSKEELFFAELRLDDPYVPTCVVSLEGVKKVGGLCGSKYDKFDGMDLPIDAQHCYACRSGLQHPKNGALYESGHVAISSFYHLMLE